MKMILPYIAVLFFVSSNQAVAEVCPKADILDLSIIMNVHAAETLESVIFRLDNYTGQRMEFSSKTLQGYRAKAANYQNISIRQVLQEQLAGTDVHFYVYKKKIWLTKGKRAVKTKGVPALY